MAFGNFFKKVTPSVKKAAPSIGKVANLALRQASLCKPNFQGNSVSIFVVDPAEVTNNQVFEWTASNFNGAPVTLQSQLAKQSFQHGDFFIEFSGQPDQTYRFKLTADSNRDLLGTFSPSNEFIFSKTVWRDKSQYFSFDCLECTDNGRALGCQIFHPNSSQCVTFHFATGTLQNQRLVPGSCAGAELFHILPQLNAEEAASINIDEFTL